MKQHENNLQMNNLVNVISNNGDLLVEKYLASLNGSYPSTYTIYFNNSSKLDLKYLFENKNIKNPNLGEKFDVTFLFGEAHKSLFETSSVIPDDDDCDAPNKNYVRQVTLTNNNLFVEIYVSKIVFYYNSNIFTLDEIITFSEYLLEIIPKEKQEEQTAKIQLITYGNYYNTVTSAIKKTVVDIKKNYNDDFIPVYDKLIDFINQRESGIALLSGPPGTGKTTLCRHLITSKSANYLFITPSVATSMGNPDFVEFLMDNKNSIFIMEDCEQLLQERSTNNWSTCLANILNMTDGILSDIFNIKFICTFNAPETVIDPALLREGRCFVNYKFDKLKADKVAVLNKENNLGIPNNEIRDMTLAELFNYQGEKKEIKKKIGF